MHAAARELNQRYWWTLLAETSQNCPKQFFEKVSLFQTLSRSNRLSGKASFTLLE